jgi:hypothetical protein
VIFSGCTFYRNSAQNGGALYLVATNRVDRCIIASSEEGVGLYTETTQDISCTDIYGNAGGDWVGAIAGLLNHNANLCADPQFCDPEHGDLTINSASLCNSVVCGVMGAWPIGCNPLSVEEIDSPSPLRIVPNPSSGPIRIQLDLPVGGNVAVRITDVAGRMVWDHAEATRSGGPVSLSWNGRDAAGRPLPASIYLARVMTASGGRTARIVLIR